MSLELVAMVYAEPLARASRTPFAAAVTLLVAALVVACGGSSQPHEEAAAPRRYEVRALVRAVPSQDSAHPEIFLHHEAIPDFVGVDGRVAGMNAMAMSLPVDDPALIAGLAPGDKVLVELEVDWEGSPPLRLLRVERLPPETVLDFGSPAAESADAPHHEH